MKVVLTDAIMAGFLDELGVGTDGNDWTIAVGWGEAELIEAVADADALVSSVLSAPVVSAARSVRLLHVTGAGWDRVPTELLPPSVSICNTFHHGRPIAEHVMMVTLMLRRHVLDADRAMRAGRWNTVATDPSVALHPTLEGSVLGVLGFGGIGREVARLAQGLGMRVQAVRANPGGSVPADIALDWVGGIDELERLMATSDVVVVTIPLDDSTRGIVGADALAAMKPSGLLVNVARGPVVDEDALFAALSSGAIGGAGIDVWWGAASASGEAPASVARFAPLANTVLTPHFSGHARSVFEGRAADIRSNLAALAAGGPLRNVVRAGVAV